MSEQSERSENTNGTPSKNGHRPARGPKAGGGARGKERLHLLLLALTAAREGDFTARLSEETGDALFDQIAHQFNEVVGTNEALVNEALRVERVVGREGRMTERVSLGEVSGGWATSVRSINALIGDLVQPTTEVARVLLSVAQGDLTQKMALEIEGQQVKGEFLRIGTTVNTMVDQLRSFAAEVTRVAKEVGTDGKLGGQAAVPEAAGTWRDLTDNVNLLANNLTAQVRNIAEVTTSVAKGDLSKKITVDAKGEVLELKNTVNTMVDQLNSFAAEVTRVAREVGTEGKLGGQADVKGVSGVWKDLTDSVNFMATNLTTQVRGIVKVVTAVANGDLGEKLLVNAKGEIAALGDTLNNMTKTLGIFAQQVTSVARTVGVEGKLGAQADVPGVAGTWKDLTQNVNLLANNLTAQVRNIAKVTTAVANGDLSQKITVDVKGEVLELKNTINTMVDQLRSFASEVTRVAKEVGTEGKLGGQAEVRGVVSGTWKDLTDNVNSMANNLTAQVRNIALVTTAVANGDLSRKITVDVKGEILELKNTINTMVDQLNSFASEVTRVAREVGTEGALGGQAGVPGVAGVWKNLTDNVNFMARNLTTQVRGISRVVTAVANGDLTRKLVVDARGEVAQLSDTINNMTDTLGTFADQVSTVAREVGIEGKLGGQAKVPGAMGTWRQLTDNVNQLAGNLTAQVRAISEVATAVTKGDLTRSITVVAEGEVAQLKDNINQMIVNLKETTQQNTEQDWLKTNLAKFSSMMQGQKDLESVSRLIMSQLTPLVSAHHGAFFILDSEGNAPVLKLTSTYAYRERKGVANRFRLGEGLVGQCALEKKSILLTRVPADYIHISSGLGESPPLNIIVLPVLFEGEVKAVIELASFDRFSAIHQIFLDQLTESLGVVLNMISANMRTAQLLQQSQGLTQDLQTQSRELTQQQDELRRSNFALEQQAVELEEKAKLLSQQNANVEIKNREVEQARRSLEEKAAQLALISKYKSEFLANMSHELRTPLNSLLILAELLAENKNGNLDEKQVEFASTIHSSGGDLLALINEILDLSKVEAGKMQIEPRGIPIAELRDFVERSFRPLSSQKGLAFDIELGEGLPASIHTDPQRLQQVLKNLLSNAFKFTTAGRVVLSISRAGPEVALGNPALRAAGNALAFAVRDTGVGISLDKQRIIFEAFQQADGTTSRHYGGTGLGLSISREITRLLGGEIHVVSRPGEGSTFTLYLPRSYGGPEATTGTADVIATAQGELLRVRGTDPQPAARTVQAPARAVRETPAAAKETPAIVDDREALAEGDRVLLVIEDDVRFARILMDMARERGFKVVVATRGDTGIELARRLLPAAITLDLQLPALDGWSLLDRLKRDPKTRHIPVHVISLVERQSARGAAMGAFAFLEKPVSKEALEGALDHIWTFVERKERRLLIVEDDLVQREAMVRAVEGKDLHVETASTGAEALRQLEAGPVDCLVLDLVLPDVDGLALLEEIKRQERFRELPTIVYTHKELSPVEEAGLRRVAESVILKGLPFSAERLVGDSALFLHRVEANLSPELRKQVEATRDSEASVAGKTALIVDDDVRNIFAVTGVLESFDMKVLHAENAVDGIELLRAHPEIAVVLMDVMMPGMDGYQAMRTIRSDPKLRSVPILAVTAKALREDRDKCLDAGASDYLPKPIDAQKLLEQIRLWTRVR